MSNPFIDFSWAGSRSTPTIPWEDITQNSHCYFDTSVYKFPCMLKSPQVLRSNLLKIFGIHQFLSLTLTSTPFCFCPYFEILKDNSLDDDNDSDDEGLQLLPTSSKGKVLTSPSLLLVSQSTVAPEPTTQNLPDESSNSPNEPAADPPTAPPPPSSSLPVHSPNLDSPIVDKTPVINSGTMEEPARKSTQSSKKTKKGGQRSKAKP